MKMPVPLLGTLTLEDFSMYLTTIGGVWLVVLFFKFLWAPWSAEEHERREGPGASWKESTWSDQFTRAPMLRRAGSAIADLVAGESGRHWYDDMTGATTYESCKSKIAGQREELLKAVTDRIDAHVNILSDTAWNITKSTVVSGLILRHDILNAIIAPAIASIGATDAKTLNRLFDSLREEMRSVTSHLARETDDAKRREQQKYIDRLNALIDLQTKFVEDITGFDKVLAEGALESHQIDGIFTAAAAGAVNVGYQVRDRVYKIAMAAVPQRLGSYKRILEQIPVV